MYSLRAFIQIPALLSNQPGVVSPIGELSAKSKTFSREVGIYRVDDYPNTMLHSFSSVLDDQLVPVDYMVASAVLQVADFLYLRSIDGTLSDDRAACQQLLLTQFGTTVQFGLVGRMVTNGTYWLPETLTITLIGQGENEIRLWFADAAFRGQYDLYEIVVVPPVPNLDDLHGQRAVVLSMLSQLTITDHVAKVQQLTATQPQTLLDSTNYDWVDKNDPTVKHPTPWTVIIYGNAGNNQDLIREALVAYILANSQWPRSEWEKIYPDLFLPLEFYLTPLWDRYSLSNMLTIAGVHSPTVPWRECMRYALGTFHNETFQHCSEWTAISQSTYKSLSFVSIGNSRNRNGVFGFEALWPDYAALPSTNGDFARMSLKTQQFSMLLTELLIVAETVTATSEIPQGYSRVKRGNYSYLAKSFDKVQYLVWLKFNDYPEVEVPELPSFGQYRLTLNATGTAGAQVIEATVSQDGTPGPISSAIPIDWFVTGDWFQTELQDGDSTQSIQTTVTSSESGSGIHTVRAEFIGSAGPVVLTATVQLQPAPAAAPEYRLTYDIAPDNVVLLKLWNGETEVEDNPTDIVGTINFVLQEIDGPEPYTSANINTRFAQFAVTSFNDWSGSRPLQGTATFTTAGGETITVTTGPFDSPETYTVDETTWFNYESIVDTDQIVTDFEIKDSNGAVLTDPSAINIELYAFDGRKLMTTTGEFRLTFTHTDEISFIIRWTWNDGTVVHSRSHQMTFPEFTSYQVQA